MQVNESAVWPFCLLLVLICTSTIALALSDRWLRSKLANICVLSSHLDERFQHKKTTSVDFTLLVYAVQELGYVSDFGAHVRLFSWLLFLLVMAAAVRVFYATQHMSPKRVPTDVPADAETWKNTRWASWIVVSLLLVYKAVVCSCTMSVVACIEWALAFPRMERTEFNFDFAWTPQFFVRAAAFVLDTRPGEDPPRASLIKALRTEFNADEKEAVAVLETMEELDLIDTCPFGNKQVYRD